VLGLRASVKKKKTSEEGKGMAPRGSAIKKGRLGKGRYDPTRSRRYEKKATPAERADAAGHKRGCLGEKKVIATGRSPSRTPSGGAWGKRSSAERLAQVERERGQAS